MVFVGFVYFKIFLERNYICTVFEFNPIRLFEGKLKLFYNIYNILVVFVGFLWKEATRSNGL